MITAMLLSISLNAVFIQNVRAADYNVTVRWTIPGDYSVSISYPTGETMIIFEPTGKTFGARDAKGQTASIRAMNLTNTGNAIIDITANFTSGAMATNITFYNMSTVFLTENQHWWIPGNCTTPQEIKDSLGVAAQQGFWAWSSGVNVPAGQVDKSLHISTAAHT